MKAWVRMPSREKGESACARICFTFTIMLICSHENAINSC